MNTESLLREVDQNNGVYSVYANKAIVKESKERLTPGRDQHSIWKQSYIATISGFSLGICKFSSLFGLAAPLACNHLGC